MGLNDETTEQLVRQVRIDLRFLRRAIDALDDKLSTAQTARLKTDVSRWLDTFFVDQPNPCPACMGLVINPDDVGDTHFDPRAMAELTGIAPVGVQSRL